LLRSRFTPLFAVAGCAVLSFGMIACKSLGSSASTIAISGAGSTFVYPVMTRWIQDYGQGGVQINYQSIGSGGGIQQIRSRTVDFGASDAPLSDTQLASMPRLIQIPETAGPVCIIYNLPGLDHPLRLSPETLAGIFLGTIKGWDDPLIARDNPGDTLLPSAINVIHRADGSGTTNIFTSYLSAVSEEWKQRAGSGNSVQWPTGIGGKGSEGVTGQLRQEPGSIGYVELTYAEQNKLPVAKIKNAAGQYVAPTAAGTTAAIAAFGAELGKDPRVPIVNPPASAADAYPIAGLTFLLLPKDGPDKAKRAALKGFVKYVIGPGQAAAGVLNYAPLPEGLKQYDAQQLSLLTAGGQALP
jgi:phosphate transport system substrate-binding protein